MSIETTLTEPDEERNLRVAKMNRDPSGEPLGVAVFLTADDLRDLGANLDTDRLAYTVVDGQLHVGDSKRREETAGGPK